MLLVGANLPRQKQPAIKGQVRERYEEHLLAVLVSKAQSAHNAADGADEREGHNMRVPREHASSDPAGSGHRSRRRRFSPAATVFVAGQGRPKDGSEGRDRRVLREAFLRLRENIARGIGLE